MAKPKSTKYLITRSVRLPESLLMEVQAYDINLSQVCREALVIAVGKCREFGDNALVPRNFATQIRQVRKLKR